MAKKVPEQIDGEPVCQSGKPLLHRGENWVTLVPEDDDDERIWEFSLTSGRLIQTRP